MKRKYRLKCNWVVSVVLTVAMSIGFYGYGLSNTDMSEIKAEKDNLTLKTFNVQIPFIANEGQIKDDQVSFYAHTFSGSFYVTKNGEMLHSLHKVELAKDHLKPSSQSKDIKVRLVKEKLVGANINKNIEGNNKSQAKVNYIIGKDKSKWRTNISTYNEVSLGEVYKGIDLRLKAYGKRVEKIFTVMPGTAPEIIRIKIDDTNFLKINAQGELEVGHGTEMVRFSVPVAYQEKNGVRKNIKVAYHLEKDAYGFSLGSYDNTLPLVIDPVLNYSTYLGGTEYESGEDIAVDSSGNTYVTGHTCPIGTDPDASAFPTTPGAYNTIFNEIYDTLTCRGDIFVTKIDTSPSGSGSLVYSTYFGGNKGDHALGIAVDTDNGAVITGYSDSPTLPEVPLPSLPSDYTCGDIFGNVFVAKFNADGSNLSYSRCFGENGYLDQARGIALGSVTPSGHSEVFITGSTTSPNAFGIFPDSYQATLSGSSSDAFAAKLYYEFIETPNGLRIGYTTYLGASNVDGGNDIAVDSSGNMYIIGNTSDIYSPPADFPTRKPYQSFGGNSDAFVAKINPSIAGDSSLIYSTYLGGDGYDDGNGIAVDSSGNVYVTGSTTSSNFPTTSGAFRENRFVSPAGADRQDIFVTKLTEGTTAVELSYSTYLGGSDDYDFESGRDIEVDSAGNAFVIGTLDSFDFPVSNPIQATNIGDSAEGTAFITKLNSAGSDLLFSTYFGGSESDSGSAIALDSDGNIYVAGSTSSTDIPMAGDPYQDIMRGVTDVFVAKIGFEPTTCSPTDNLIANYQFDGDASDSSGTSPNINLVNTNFVNDHLYLNGLYYPDCPTTGYQATAEITNFNFDAFTISLDFNSKEFGTWSPGEEGGHPTCGFTRNILTGGFSNRWFRLRRHYTTENLELTLNNLSSYTHEFPDTELTVNQWHTVVVSVNLLTNKIITFLDGVNLGEISLPPGFVLSHDFENIISFTDLSNATIFKGHVDNLRVYSCALSPEQIQASIPLPDSDGDGIADLDDNCAAVPNGPTQAGIPGVGDQDDFDVDGVGDACDNCPKIANGPDASVPGGGDQLDLDGDGVGDACDNCPGPGADERNERVPYLLGASKDKCATSDFGVAEGDLWQPDYDCDGVGDACENCKDTPNGPLLGTCIAGEPALIGETCGEDSDCGTTGTPTCSMNQEDSDGDKEGDACDQYTVTLDMAATYYFEQEKIYIGATLRNDGPNIWTIAPDCWNTSFIAREQIPSNYEPLRLCLFSPGHSIPRDRIYWPSGTDRTITCEITQWYRDGTFSLDDPNTSKTWVVDVTHGQYIQDNRIGCDENDPLDEWAPCPKLKIGKVKAVEPIEFTLYAERTSVEIDFKPDDPSNTVNLGSKGVKPVAIFSKAGFNATDVNPLSITLGDKGVRIKGKGTPMVKEEDLNGENLVDLVAYIETEGMELTEGSKVVLLGEISGDPIVGIIGEDVVRVVPAK